MARYRHSLRSDQLGVKMAAIKISSFCGMIPKSGDRQLPENAATVAENCKLYSGNLIPLRPPYTSSSPTKTNPFLALFRARTGPSTACWFTWPFDVDCVRVPLATDVESRFVWTGDGAPKFAKYSTATTSGTNNYPSNFFDLGIPNPQTIPVATPTGGSGTLADRYFVYTFFSQDGEESGPSPVSAVVQAYPNATWSVTMPDATPTNSGTGTAAYGTVTTFTAAALHWLRVGDEIYFTAGAGIDTGLLHTVASATSGLIFTVTGNYANATAYSRRTNWNITGLTRRLYRTTLGTTASFQLVAESLTASPYTDAVGLTDGNIPGDDLISNGWEPPPTGIRGVCVHSSGALCGFVNNLICFSEPLQPHAWPVAYQLSAGASGVGLGTFGSVVVLATIGAPYAAIGVEPATMTGEDIPGTYPCLSKRSVVGTGSGVIYASRHGLVSVSQTGVSLISETFYTRDEWDVVNPETMICAVANDRIYILYTTDTSEQRVLVFDGQFLTKASVTAQELYADPSTGELYVTNAGNVQLWDSVSSVPMYATWRSKEFVFPEPVNLGVARVDFYPDTDAGAYAALIVARNAIIASNAVILSNGVSYGGYNEASYDVYDTDGSAFQEVPTLPAGNTVTFNLYRSMSETLVFSKTMSSNAMFRLPAGYKDDTFFVELVTQTEVEAVWVGETADSLRAG